MSPWIIGFLAFTLYPMVSSLYFSFTSYDLLSTPAWIGLENYRFMFTKDPLFWTAIKNTAWIIIVGVPLRILVGDRHRRRCSCVPGGRQGLPHDVLHADARPGGRGRAGVPLPVQPRDRPGEPGAVSGIGIKDPPLWLYDAQWSKPTLVLLASGGSATR